MLANWTYYDHAVIRRNHPQAVVEIRTFPGPSAVRYEVTGPAELAFGHACRIISEHHPAGYGTHITHHVDHGDGTRTYHVWRAASCD